MSKEILCDPQLRAVGKPLIGRAIGTMIGTAFGCATSRKRCSPTTRVASTLLTASLGYAIGAAWDSACKQ